MKPIALPTIVGTIAASFFVASAWGQAAPLENRDHLPSTRRLPASWADHRINGTAKASDLIGMTVKNYQDEKLGKVEDLAVDVESGRIAEVILSVGGIAGIADTLTAVPPGALHHDVAQQVLHLDVDKVKLKAAPKYDASQSNDSMYSNRVVAVYTYYGTRPYFVSQAGIYSDSLPDHTDAKLASTLPRHMDGTINTEAGRTVDRVRNEEAARRIEGTNDYVGYRRTTNASWSKLGYVEKASKLLGMSVKNLQDEKLGKVENMLVDVAAGRIVVVIISSGGLMGIGDDLTAIPPTALRFTPGQDALRLDVSKDRLANSPHFKSKEWPDFNEPAYVARTYRTYNVTPYFATDRTIRYEDQRRDARDVDHRRDTTTDADNTARNVRDRNDGTLTPLDQGNSQLDIDTTAQIRKEILAHEQMSVNAQNVKVITKDGNVTLRGPVRDASEKNFIGEIARRNARGSVNNQLEIQAVSPGN